MPVISNVRHRRSRIQMRNTRGAFALRCWATAERAARPASLASSARTAILEVVCSQASVRAARPLASGAPAELFVAKIRFARRAVLAGTAQVRSRSRMPHSVPSVSALDAHQSTVAFSSAVGVGVCSVVLGGPASKIKAGCALQSALPNLAINRTASGSRLSPR